MPTWKEFVSWVFFGLLAFYGYSISTNMDKITDSVATLNVNMAVVAEKLSFQSKEIGRLDTRVEKLENRN